MFDGITERQADVLRVIVDEDELAGRPPTMARVANRLGLSRVTVDKHAAALVRAGYLIQGPGKRPMRAYRIDPRARAALGRGFPLLGSIPAGPLSDALGDLDDSETLTRIEDLVPGLRPGDFRLLIDGDSMDEAGLLDGMTAFFRPNVRPAARQICAVYVEGEGGTVKRVEPHHHRVRLIPDSSNPVHVPVDLPADQVLVQGVLVASFSVRLF